MGMGGVRVHDFSVSLDGYAAGPAQFAPSASVAHVRLRRRAGGFDTMEA